MIAILLRLQWMTLRGRVVRSIRLLRQPKYLVGFVVGAAWMGFWFLRPMLHARFGSVTMARIPASEELTGSIHRLAALVLTIIFPVAWLLPWGPLGLPFREAELTLLLQAPLTRRQIIQYGLLKAEPGILFGAVLVSFMHLNRGPLGWLLGFVATWMLFELWHLNGRWRALFNLRQRELPVAVARRRRFLLTLGLLGLYVLVLFALAPFLRQAVEALRASDAEQVFANLRALEWPPLLVAVCSPAFWLTAPLFAAGVGSFLAAILPLVVALAAQREVVLRTRARFEEIALEQAAKRETRKAPGRRFSRLSVRTRSSEPFSLGPSGDPAVALVWKNVVRVSRLSWRRAALLAPLLLAALAVIPALLRVHEVAFGAVAAFGVCIAIMSPIGAGMFWNNDLRTELAHLELLRTWPVSARRLVLAEVVSPALLSCAASALGLGLLLVSFLGSRLREALSGEATSLVFLPRAGILGTGAAPAAILLLASALAVAGAVSFFSSSVQNLATLFVPAWMAQSADRSQGVAAFGQRMVSFSALFLALVVGLIPGALLVGAAALLQSWIGIPWSAWELPVWALLVAGPYVAGAFWIVELSARLWERLDPSQELLEIGR